VFEICETFEILVLPGIHANCRVREAQWSQWVREMFEVYEMHGTYEMSVPPEIVTTHAMQGITKMHVTHATGMFEIRVPGEIKSMSALN
jgi:hypothetical protein